MSVSEYLTAEAFTKHIEESPKEMVQRSERLFNELDALLDQVGEKLQELRLASCFAPQGQPIVARVRVPKVRGISKTLTSPKLGSRVELRVRGVGPASEREDVSTTIVVPTSAQGADTLIVDAQEQGEMIVTGRLRPRFYPRHDVLVARSLDKLAKLLQPDELSWLKLPGAAVKKVGENEGLVWREPWCVTDDAEFTLRKRKVRSQPPIPRRCALHHILPSTAPAHHPTRS